MIMPPMFFENCLCSDFVDWDIGRVEKSSTYEIKLIFMGHFGFVI